MKRLILYIILFFITSCVVKGQTLFESGIVYGGVTGGGFSTNSGSGIVISNIAIPQNSVIKKAYLLAVRNNEAPNITVVLNNINYTFSNSSIASNNFTSVNITSIQYNNSTIHALDILNDIDSSVFNYSLTIPPQFNVVVNGYYSSFYLYIVYENLSLPKINYSLFINNQDVSPLSNYNLLGLPPINNNKPVGLELFNYFFCDTVQDASYVYVNGSQLGLLGGSDANASLWSCTGTYANFAHYNDSLFGLDDDTPDSLMLATDALADIKSYVNNGDTSVNVTFTYQSNWGPFSNPIAAIMLSYTTPCDTFSTTITANDTICLGDSVQLQATGGLQYSWYSPLTPEGGIMGGLSDTSIANPIATPTQTTTYIVTIKNDSGCVKTEQVKIWVNPLPVADTLIVTNNFCGDSVGSLQVGTISNGGSPFMYSLTNLQTLTTQNSLLNTFNNLGTGNYELLITDVNGCTFNDTATITQTNSVQANFTANPNGGVAPLLVDFSNVSLNANAFQWSVVSNQLDTLVWIPACAGNTAVCGLQYEFENSGSFQTCLVAYNNLPTCADTVCKTIVIEDEISFVIPNVFTPNFDNGNDNFLIQLTGASLIKELKVEIFNRWGETVKSEKFKVESSQNSLPTTQYTIWDGRTTAAKLAPAGTYFYVVSYTLKDDGTSVQHKKGSVTLLR